MFTETLINFATNFISAVGYPGIFLLAMLEGLIIPVPLEATLIFSGFLVSIGSFNLLNVILMGALGNLLGSTVSFLFFKHIGSRGVSRLINHYGHIFLISDSELLSLNKFFKKHGPWTIILIRFIPGFRTILTIPVGLSKIDLKFFLIIYTISSLLVSATLTYIGLRISSSWYQIVPVIKKVDFVIIGSFAILFTIYLRRKLKKSAKT